MTEEERERRWYANQCKTLWEFCIGIILGSIGLASVAFCLPMGVLIVVGVVISIRAWRGASRYEEDT